jgi:hypothetical protein
MLKKLVILLILAILCAVSGGFYVYFTRPSQFAPFPYLTSSIDYGENLELASAAQVLIVGDRFAKDYSRFEKTLQDHSSANLQVPLKIFSWGTLHESGHRTLNKLSALKKWPKVILYMGGSEEYYEKNFNLEDFNKIKMNFDLFHDPRYSTLVYAFPTLAKFLYKEINWVRLDQTIREDRTEYDSNEILKIGEMKYFLFSEHLKEMTRLADANHSKIIFVTAPINLLIPPKKTCESARSTDLENKLNDIKPLIEDNQHKVAYGLLKPLINNYTGHAELYYLFGKLAIELGEKTIGLEALNKAAIFDCRPYRANLVYNKIMLDVAQSNNHPLIDFDSLISSHIQENDAFIDNIYVQNNYYQLLTLDISKLVTYIFQI